MKKTAGRIFIFFSLSAWLLIRPGIAMATQGHGGIEGVYAHQFGHLFFIISMGILIYWLRRIDLIAQIGWRYIQYAALFFILWNLDAMAVHFLDDQSGIIQVGQLDRWHLKITARAGFEFLIPFYYLAKLDHLLCVPALLFLFFGLKRLIADTEPALFKSDPS